jgi:hypothetical protein
LLIGVTQGTAPFSSEQIHEDQVNVHVHVSYYYDFVADLRSDA